MSAYHPASRCETRWDFIPIAVTLFVDVVLQKLENSGVGCYIEFQNAIDRFMYTR